VDGILTISQLSDFEKEVVGVVVLSSSTLDPMIVGCELLQSLGTQGNVSSLDFKVLLVPEQSSPLVRGAFLLILDFSSCFLLE
jgi:hypothetical protein